MSDSSTRSGPRAEPVAVVSGEGVRLPGWAVRADTVVVQAGGLHEPIRVRVGDEWVAAEAVHEAVLDPESDQPWTALELPVGALDVASEGFPPGIAPPDPEPRQGSAWGVSFWCLVFPRMRGC